VPDAARAIMDGQGLTGLGSVDLAESSGKAVIRGLTFRAGSSESGGAFEVFDALELDGTVFEGNHASAKGGALSIRTSEGSIPEVSITRSAFRGNSASLGGAIHVAAGRVSLMDTELSDNLAGEDTGEVAGGGALVCEGGSVVAERAVFEGNRSWGAGGAILAKRGCEGLQVVESTLRMNEAAGRGGGLAFSDASGVVERSRLQGNRAADGAAVALSGSGRSLRRRQAELSANEATARGGGVFVSQGDVTVQGSLVVRNTSADGGAAYAELGARLWVVQSTLAENGAAQNGALRAPWLWVQNSIVWGNHAPSSPAITVTDDLAGGEDNVGYVHASDVEGLTRDSFEWCSDCLYCTATKDKSCFVATTGLDADPLFEGPDSWRLAAGSPCRDAGELQQNGPGTPASWYVDVHPRDGTCSVASDREDLLVQLNGLASPASDANLLLTDLLGLPRVQGVGIDLGAYEMPVAP